MKNYSDINLKTQKEMNWTKVESCEIKADQSL